MSVTQACRHAGMQECKLACVSVRVHAGMYVWCVHACAHV